MVCKSSLFLSWLLHKNIKGKMCIYVTMFVYICIFVEDSIIKGGKDTIKRFNPATCFVPVPILVLYFKRYISLSLLVKQFEARGGCSFCWYWWNCIFILKVKLRWSRQVHVMPRINTTKIRSLKFIIKPDLNQ
jgi:hypothetical protein